MNDILKEYAEGKRDFTNADLSRANLSRANLHGANLGGANLRDASLSCANLRDASLSGANLSNANLSDANLFNADLCDADLRGAYLSGADLSRAVGIVSFGPVGSHRHIGYAVAHYDGPRVQLGCFWGTLDDACTAIVEEYGEASAYEALVRAACAVVAEKK